MVCVLVVVVVTREAASVNHMSSTVTSPILSTC